MEQTTWIVLGLVATVVTGAMLRFATAGGISPSLGVIGSAIAMVLWGRWGLAAYAGIAQTSECCTKFSYYEGLGLMGVTLAAIMLASTVKAALLTFEEEI